MEKKEVLSIVERTLEESDFLQKIRIMRKGLFPDSLLRLLSKEEILKLEEEGNWAEDWGKVKVVKEFSPGRVKNSNFFGENVLGAFKEELEIEEGVKIPSGIYNSTLINAQVGNNALIKEVKLLSRSIVGERAILFNVGEITGEEESTFGNGEELSIAIETGGREVKVYAEMTLEIAEKVARFREKDFLHKYQELVDKYTGDIKSNYSFFFPRSQVKNTPQIHSVILGEEAKIDNARKVANSTILSNEEEETEIKEGALVTHSLLQWGCEVTSMAIVDHSLLIEHSHVERHGKVTQSILGANTGVGEGEVTASLVGPFVGFHHQALLIAALWPEGKGNVGYGANVGSNHTSKAPDQEIWPGEGMFFGLGVNIKFPANYIQAPYSIIATGVNTLPQKVEFPFSLINTPAAVYSGISPAFNEIMPGWVLSDNIFTIRRNEGKYRKRNKARRAKIVFEVFRPEIVDMLKEARKKLQVREIKEIYTSRDISGLGKNYLLERRRRKGIEAYTFYIRYYALLGLKRKIESLLSQRREIPPRLLEESSPEERWEHERKIIQEEFPNEKLENLLQVLIKMQEKVAQDVEFSKDKDDQRGVKIIEDYLQTHTSADKDDFVQETWKETAKLKKEVEEILAILK